MRARGAAGYTLIELLVVVAVLALASALALPALLRSRIGDPPLQAIVESARAAAARRGEIIYLRIEPTGVWYMEGGGSPLERDSAGGRIAPLASAPLTLLVSPSGSCAFDVRSTAGARVLALDPLTCTVRASAASTSS
jgi:prepilin-type N-terminal cleavage/methylation domain-containing protein